MGNEATVVKANRELVKRARELGANIRKIVDIALEDFIERNLSPKSKRIPSQPHVRLAEQPKVGGERPRRRNEPH